MSRLQLGGILVVFCPASIVAGGLERGAPSPGILFKPGDVAEFKVSYSVPSLDGSVTVGAFGEQQSGNMLESTLRVGAGVKRQAGEHVSYALVFEQPHWARVNYDEAGERYPYRDSFAEFSEQRLTLWGKYQPSERFSFYGGPIVSSTKMSAGVKVTVPNPADGSPLTVLDYSGAAPYKTALGYAAGLAWENQAKAQRLSLTYFSELEFDVKATETARGVNVATGEAYVIPESDIDSSFKLPQSVTLSAQTGLNKKTLLFGSVRWADWSEYRIAPSVYEAVTGGALSALKNDTTTFSLGVGRKLNEQLSLFAVGSYEKAQGGLKGNLSPGDGSKSLALGGSYRMGQHELRVGLQHTLIGDAKTNATVGESSFTDNSGTGVGLTLTTKF
ncbi:MAG: outer membrane protein transport protein [Thiolinea sp.]